MLIIWQKTVFTNFLIHGLTFLYKNFVKTTIFCRYSSVVEHIIGNDEAESSILSSGTTEIPKDINFTKGACS